MNSILILDFGSQYTQLIARRVREAKVYCEIHPCTMPIKDIRKLNPKGIILSGGPASVLAKNAPLPPRQIFDLKIPILGICYVLQSTVHMLGGKVEKSAKREYGRAHIQKIESHPILKGLKTWPMQVWMSHGDRAKKLPRTFRPIAKTDHSPHAIISNKKNTIIALQFHPEVSHTPEGSKIISNFLDICRVKRNWTAHAFVMQAVEKIKKEVGKEKVILGLSGGVDSSVAAMLIHRAIGNQLTCIFVDNGLLRHGEARRVEKLFKKHFHIRLIIADAQRLFLSALAGVVDPEKKRKIIGRTFIEVFEREAGKIKGASFLAQGTLYPDVIESVSCFGPSVTIKSHHNVGGLPKRMKLKLLEPLKWLFKDEVRLVGHDLGLPSDLITRQPFPGPGLGVRVIGEVTTEALEILRNADVILQEEIKAAGFYEKLWQSFCVLLPIRTVGVMGDERTYENVCAIRAVYSTDGMTADWAKLPMGLLSHVSNRIINEVKGINRVVYDISSKPPATIEWE